MDDYPRQYHRKLASLRKRIRETDDRQHEERLRKRLGAIRRGDVSPRT